jgi:hypothetical protein
MLVKWEAARKGTGLHRGTIPIKAESLKQEVIDVTFGATCKIKHGRENDE